jgi:hypothetical protein
MTDAMRTVSSDAARPLTVGLRRLLLVASALVFLAGIPLYLGTEQTDLYFAWTVKPPITAAFLGAAYWASCVLELLSARERLWARARLAVPAVLAFTALMLLATLLHLDRFQFDSPNLVARGVTWAWLAIYVGVPPAALVLLFRQLRVPGGEPPRVALLPAWVRLVLAVHGAIMLTLGVVLLLAPGTSAVLWPWMLTPLTARAVGAWLVGLGVAAAAAYWENDFVRVRVGFITYALLAALQFVTLARYPGALDWSLPSSWLYVVFLLSIFIVGAYGWVSATRLDTASRS